MLQYVAHTAILIPTQRVRATACLKCRLEQERPFRSYHSSSHTSKSAITSLPFPIYSRAAQFYPTRRKLIYCSRTVPEIEKALTELKRLMAYRVANAESDEQKKKELAYTGLGLTSRKNLCINPDVCMLRYPRSIQQLLICSRWLKRRKGMSWTHVVGISQAWLR